jgi:hypothetical protein
VVVALDILAFFSSNIPLPFFMIVVPGAVFLYIYLFWVWHFGGYFEGLNSFKSFLSIKDNA